VKGAEINIKAKIFFIVKWYWRTEKIASVLREWGEHYNDLPLA
jgi:hypothetical protein